MASSFDQRLEQILARRDELQALLASVSQSEYVPLAREYSSLEPVVAGIERSQPGAGAVDEAEEVALASVAKERRADPARRPRQKYLQLLPVIHAISSGRESARRKRRMPHGLVCGHRNRVQSRALTAD